MSIKNCISTFGAALSGTAMALVLAIHPAWAAPISLDSKDGALSIQGDFIDFDGTHYTIDTALGKLRVSAELVTCTGPGCPASERNTVVAERPARIPLPPRSELVNISGSDAIGSLLMPLLIEGYAGVFDGAIEAVRNNEVEKVLAVVDDGGFGDRKAQFRILTSITSDAFANLVGRSTEIGMASRAIPDAQADILAKTGAGDMRSAANEHIVALDSIVVIAHPDNPVGAITMSQLRDIYSGKITNWAEVGGRNAQINVVNRMAGTSTRQVFEDLVFAESDVGVPAKQSVVDSFEDVALTTRQNEDALAYVPIAYIGGAKPLDLVSACGITMTPDPFSIRTEDYNLGRFLYLYTRQDTLSPEGADFLDFIKSNDAANVILKAGYIDLGVDRQSQDLTGERAALLLEESATFVEEDAKQDMLRALVRNDRLSSTFRFETGSDRLTDRAQLNLERLVDYAADLPSGSRLTFVGFADSIGDFQNNLLLSEARANRVLTAFDSLPAANGNDIIVRARGFGELAPTSCNDTDEGRSLNRRVEVWIEK